jgi:hypothetical protein
MNQDSADSFSRSMPPELRARVVEILAEALLAYTHRHPDRYGLAETKAQATGPEVAR